MSKPISSTNYLTYWGLDKRPFENTRDPYFFFESREHREALERILYTIEDGNMGMGMLTGEIGSGKTCVKTVVEERLPTSRYGLVSMENGNFPAEYILWEINRQLSGKKREAPEKKPEKFLLVTEFRHLLEKHIQETNKHLVILIDEAQDVAEEALIELKNLTNISAVDENFITLILFGQPELREKIQKLPQINQRISLRFHLNGLAQDEVSEYIRFRIMRAGREDAKIFQDSCHSYIYKETNGTPREINRICKLALDRTFSLQLPQVTDKIILGIIRDLHKQNGLL